jgi:hypothetical protein
VIPDWLANDRTAVYLAGALVVIAGMLWAIGEAVMRWIDHKESEYRDIQEWERWIADYEARQQKRRRASGQL